VIQAMASATGSWEAAANVKYVHVSAQDSNCTSSNTNVLFDVNPVNAGGQYLARAFFPGNSRSSRNVLIDNSAFGGTQPTLAGVLRHELGHTLGWRHEHTRPESGTCFEDNSWRALTTYDSASVMHYPQCNGTGGWALNLTAKDIAGAQAVYGAAGGQPPPPPPPTGTSTQTLTGSVAKAASQRYAPFDVTPGTTFQVVMSGSGDPDLYVRFDSEPTLTAYDCRPYKTGAAETCAVTVPASRSKAYVMVYGYEAGSFTLNVQWTKPATTPGTGTPKTATFSGSVAQGQDVFHGPLSVLAGTTFQVVMSGSGDPDLYVKFGAQPTATVYDCRPYLDGPNETCTVTVPAGQTSAYMMVRGFAAGTYALNVSYTSP
jgi:serine protease